MELTEYIAPNGDVLLYTGEPDLKLLDELASGSGDLWHSSLDQGFKNIFPELVYQIAVFWYYLNDFDNLYRSVNWRINPNAFVVRKKVWELTQGFSTEYDSKIMAALDFGFGLLRYRGGVPLYVSGLFKNEANDILISSTDRYIFYKKNFKKEHAINMLLKRVLKNPSQEVNAFFKVQNKVLLVNNYPMVLPKGLNAIHGSPTVSVIIPTMHRQNYTLNLLRDYNSQKYPVNEVIVVDATPENDRDENLYKSEDYNFELIVRWQESKGSCRARNEAIDLCKGDYIIFADDDTRILPDFVENHIKFIQTNKIDACNGMDIHANSHTDDLEDLNSRLDQLGEKRWKAGAAQTFSNANACVKKEWVTKLIGNDINFDGGYGEDTDYGMRIIKEGGLLFHNPFSAILHLKPPTGGYRTWGLQSAVLGKKRKRQAWELDSPVKFIKPVPSPTIVYGILKHFKTEQVKEYKSKYFFLYLFNSSRRGSIFRLLNLPYKIVQFNRSMFYAKKLIQKGVRYK